MQKKFILKFNAKDNILYCNMYKSESIRIQGRVQTQVGNLNIGNIHHTLDKLIMQFDKEFEIGFKKNNLKSIRAWLKSNIYKIYISNTIPEVVYNSILKLIGDKCLIIKD